MRTTLNPETGIELVVFDMAGTTVADGGLVTGAADAALRGVGLAPGGAEHANGMTYVRDTMGQSKIEVFRAILGAEQHAQDANRIFEVAYNELVDAGICRPIDGAEQVIRTVTRAGIKVALTTGFAASTQQAILRALGWQDLAHLTLNPGDVARGRPYPDMVLTAVLRLGISDVRRIAVVGDTPSDVLSGLRAGASIAAGVLTGTGDRDAFAQAGATHVLESVRDLPALVVPGDAHATDSP